MPPKSAKIPPAQVLPAQVLPAQVLPAQVLQAQALPAQVLPAQVLQAQALVDTGFHPAVAAWFASTFVAPTPAQADAWPAIKAGQNVLVAAPTGSGKTLSAFLAAIDTLVWQSQQTDLFGELPDQVQVLYVSPLKALSNDIQKNLQTPLEGIRAELAHLGMRDAPIRTMVRSGDTSQSDRALMRKRPPHILVTTPESLYLLLTAESGRHMLAKVRTVIVDEIHALASNKRGAHLALSLERLQALCGEQLLRIGLSATQKPLSTVARFLCGDREKPCRIIDSGHQRERDLGIEVPGSPLEAVMAAEVWQEVYARLVELALEHRTTLIFVNTRRLAERLARHLSELLVQQGLSADVVTSHHGSLSKEHRLDAEQRLKTGQLRILVATASLELGLDIGDIDLVCQIGSPRAISVFLQRVGRSGHALQATPKGRLFPCSRDELIECTALLDAIRRGELDHLTVPLQPMDVLAQQLVAEVAGQDWDQDALYELVCKAWPYRNLTQVDFTAVLEMLADGYSTRRGRRGAYLHWDRVNKNIRARRSARLVALTNGGAIPDLFDYDVMLQPEGSFVGTLNEDFAFESMPGDIFQLGNTSYRILKIEPGKVLVADAAGEPPNLPFWLGEAPGRSDELSHAVAGLRHRINHQLETLEPDQVIAQLVTELTINGQAAVQIVEYLATAKACLGRLPDAQHIIFERFFDEAGDQHLVIHSSFGSRINRAWGLALRKRFCRKFNFELQAAALEDSIVLSLGSTHSFDLEDVQYYLKPSGLRELLVQAVLAVPMFPTHWRWVTNIALAVKRNYNGKRAPAQFQRMDAEDLIAVIFPDQLACAENLAGEREVPDHPLVKQALQDCLTEVMDVEGLQQVISRLENRKISVSCCDLAGPSPLAQEILTARPYAFLDDAPAEERRTQMVQARRFANPEDAKALGRLSLDAVSAVRKEAWPLVRDAEELHDAIFIAGVFTDIEIQAINNGIKFCQQLQEQQRLLGVQLTTHTLWVTRERLHEILALHAGAEYLPQAAAINAVLDPADALRELVRSRLEVDSPLNSQSLAEQLVLPKTDIEIALLALQQEGFAMRGMYRSDQEEWCERGLLARMHRYTLERLRKVVKPVPLAQLQQFLFAWQGLTVANTAATNLADNAEALLQVIEQLEGFALPAAAWESAVLPLRMASYWADDLDQLCSSGRLLWLRLHVSEKIKNTGRTALKTAAVALAGRKAMRFWQKPKETQQACSVIATRVIELLQQRGALFFEEISEHLDVLPMQLEESLAELVVNGSISCDSFAGLRALMRPNNVRGSRRRGRRIKPPSLDEVGRWSLCHSVNKDIGSERTEHIAQVLLRRYGLVFRKLLERETGLPSWRELLYVYRRMEARGEVRGGRFVTGFSGEQFVLPEAIGLLRKAEQQQLVVISAADPLNFTGILFPGERIPARLANRLVYKQGIPMAALLGKEIRYLKTPSNEQESWSLQQALHLFSRAQTTKPTSKQQSEWLV